MRATTVALMLFDWRAKRKKKKKKPAGNACAYRRRVDSLQVLGGFFIGDQCLVLVVWVEGVEAQEFGISRIGCSSMAHHPDGRGDIVACVRCRLHGAHQTTFLFFLPLIPPLFRSWVSEPEKNRPRGGCSRFMDGGFFVGWVVH